MRGQGEMSYTHENQQHSHTSQLWNKVTDGGTDLHWKSKNSTFPYQYAWKWATEKYGSFVVVNAMYKKWLYQVKIC